MYVFVCTYAYIFIYVYSFIHSISSVTLESPDNSKLSNPTPIALNRFCAWGYNLSMLPSVVLPACPTLLV